MPRIPASRRRNTPTVYSVTFDGEYHPFYSLFQTKAAATYFARRVVQSGARRSFHVICQRLESALDIPEIVAVHFKD